MFVKGNISFSDFAVIFLSTNFRKTNIPSCTLLGRNNEILDKLQDKCTSLHVK